MKSRLLSLFCLLALTGLVPVCAAEEPPPDDGLPLEYRVKAAFLHGFLKFIEWPADALPPGHSKIVVGVAGDGPMVAALRAIANKTVQGRGMVVLPVSRPADYDACEVLFFSRGTHESDRGMEPVIEALAGRPILTIGEEDGFLEAGGVINFVLIEERVRFEINVEAAERAGLLVQSGLLQVARRYSQ